MLTKDFQFRLEIIECQIYDLQTALRMFEKVISDRLDSLGVSEK